MRPGAACRFGEGTTRRDRRTRGAWPQRGARAPFSPAGPGPAGLQSWGPSEGGCTGHAGPEHSPSSEEKDAEVSMALWKFSSIFRPSSMFGPGREDLQGRGSGAPGVRAFWDREPAAAALLGKDAGRVQGHQKEPGGSSPAQRNVGWEARGASPRTARTDPISLEVNAFCT